MNLTHVIQGDAEVVADLIRFNLEEQPHPFVQKWETLLEHIDKQAEAYEPDYSQMAAVKYLEQQLSPVRSTYGRSQGENSQLSTVNCHYANSSAIRLANIYSKHPVYCNRGVNGIEGSLSTAAGFSVVEDDMVFCVIGDLSFFYDQNALWNQNLKGNLRILLLNNGKGGIFDMLPGLEKSPARDKFVSAQHHTSAEGICQQNHVHYRKADSMEAMKEGIDWLTTESSSRPMLLEVFTDSSDDECAYRKYYDELTTGC